MIQFQQLRQKCTTSVLSILCLGLISILLTAPYAQAVSAINSVKTDAHGKRFEDTSAWATRQQQIAFSKIMANISRPDAAPGSVVAAPSRSNPDYYFHWIRDAALTMDTVVGAYQTTQNKQLKDQLAHVLMDYVSFSRTNQISRTLTGLGEPKFNVDGSPYNLPWGRPQNDGPALRAITATHLAFILLREGQTDYVRRSLYDGTLPTSSLIKTDLEYVAHHWRDTSFDLWEEVRASHFYTRMVQRRALIEGAQLARILGDAGAANFYSQQATLISQDLGRFLRPDTQSIAASLDWAEGVNYKNSNLDVAVLLGVLHGDANDGYFSASNPWVLSTAQRLVSSFAQIYNVNRAPNAPGVAIGRYPEDQYSGSNFSGGNPWLLATAAVGEIYFKAAQQLKVRDPQSAARYRALGEQFLQRIQYHSNPDGSMYEQWDRNSGYATSAPDLTWSYVSFLTLMNARAASASR